MLTNTCKYGIRALIYIASKSENNKNIIGIKKISEELNLPTPFLSKILHQLVKSKVLGSLKGPHGGYYFVKHPDKVSLYDVVLIIDGNRFFDDCIIQNRTCRSADEEELLCPIHEEFSKIRESISMLFKSRTIQDLVESARNSGEVIL